MLQRSREDARVLTTCVIARHAAFDRESAFQEELECFDVGLCRREPHAICARFAGEPDGLVHEPCSDAVPAFARNYRNRLNPRRVRAELDDDEAEALLLTHREPRDALRVAYESEGVRACVAVKVTERLCREPLDERIVLDRSPSQADRSIQDRGHATMILRFIECRKTAERRASRRALCDCCDRDVETLERCRAEPRH